MYNSLRTAVLVLACLALPLPAAAQPEPGVMKEDKGHVYTWNRFADDLFKLHQQVITGQQVVEESRLGGYVDNPEFYREVRYLDADSGRLLGVVQREVKRPENIHSLSVYRYDDQGRLKRDYSFTYLPVYRNAPVQTLIFLHRYNGELHAWRSFDASDQLLDESCSGTLQGKPVSITMDIDEIEAAQAERYQHQRGILTEPAYLACFEDMPETAADVLPPR